MTTNGGAHPLARRLWRDRRLAVIVEVAILAALVVTTWAAVVTDEWSWWHLPLIAGIVLLGTAAHSYLVDGFTLDDNNQPITGRDADQFALWKLESHQRHT